MKPLSSFPQLNSFLQPSPSRSSLTRSAPSGTEEASSQPAENTPQDGKKLRPFPISHHNFPDLNLFGAPMEVADWRDSGDSGKLPRKEEKDPCDMGKYPGESFPEGDC